MGDKVVRVQNFWYKKLKCNSISDHLPLEPLYSYKRLPTTPIASPRISSLIRAWPLSIQRGQWLLTNFSFLWRIDGTKCSYEIWTKKLSYCWAYMQTWINIILEETYSLTYVWGSFYPPFFDARYSIGRMRSGAQRVLSWWN